MDISITKMSSKGQVVIPLEFRENIKEGEKLMIIKNNNQIILQKIGDVSNKFEEDIEFAKRTEEAIKRIDQGIEMNFDEAISEMKKW